MKRKNGLGKSRPQPLDGATQLYSLVTAAHRERKECCKAYIAAYERAAALELAFALYTRGRKAPNPPTPFPGKLHKNGEGRGRKKDPNPGGPVQHCYIYHNGNPVIVESVQIRDSAETSGTDTDVAPEEAIPTCPKHDIALETSELDGWYCPRCHANSDRIRHALAAEMRNQADAPPSGPPQVHKGASVSEQLWQDAKLQAVLRSAMEINRGNQ